MFETVMDDGQFAFYLVTAAVIFGLLGAMISSGRGHGMSGFFWGFLLGPIGLLIAALQQPPKAIHTGPAATRECPHCKEQIRRDASVCPHCQRDSEPWAFHDGSWWAKGGSDWYRLDERAGEWQGPIETETPSQ